MSERRIRDREAPLNWAGILRLGLVQTALGAIVVLTTATLNRAMVVELQLPATVPGALVALHYFVQVLRPRWGHGSDVGGRRTPWIVGGMLMLSAGGLLAALATAWMSSSSIVGVLVAVVAYLLIGIGVGAAGTSLLVLVAKRVAAERRPAAASIMWMMMIAGFVVTAALTGHFLDPFSPARLVAVSAIAVTIAFAVSLLAVLGIEGSVARLAPVSAATVRSQRSFADAIRLVWSESQSRRFTLFILISMLAYSAQDLILEPFAGVVFGYTLGQSTQLSALQNGGVLAGMIVVAVAGRMLRWSLRTWTAGGCVLSALSLLLIASSGSLGWSELLRVSTMALGFGNGVFAVAAIGSMMDQASSGHADREGVRVGLWGAAQAVAFAIGGLMGASGVDLARSLIVSPALAYGSVFAVEALLFLCAARLATAVESSARFASPDADMPGISYVSGASRR